MSRESIIARMQQLGMSDSAIYGAMVSIKAESGFDSTVHEGYTGGGLWESGGYGVCQWTDPSRKQGLQDLANSRGVSVSDENTQVDYMVHELKAYGLFDKMNNASPQDAARMFMMKFEKPADQSEGAFQGRIADYDKVSGGAPTYQTPQQIANSDQGYDPYATSLAPQLAIASGGAFRTEQDPVITHPDYPEPTTLSVFGNNFVDGIKSSWWYGGIQDVSSALFHSSINPSANRINDDDIQMVKAALPNNKEAQEWALLHARDRSQLQYLIQQKQEEQQRKARLADWFTGHAVASTLGQIGGSLVDPAILIPVGGEAGIGLKIASRMGGFVYDTYKASRIARAASKIISTGAEAGAFNVAATAAKDQFWGWGEKPDYAHAALSGFLAGSILKTIGMGAKASLQHYSEGRMEAATAASKAEAMETYAMKEAAGIGKVREETRNVVEPLNNKDFIAKSNSKLLKQFADRGEVVAVDSGTARSLLLEHAGINLPDTAKAFWVPNENYAMLLTDRVPPNQIDNVLAHELGAHGYLPAIMGERYQPLMDKVAKEATTKGTKLYEARLKANLTDPEEILAYAIEHNMLKQKLLSSLTNNIRAGFKDMGFNLKWTTDDVKDLLMRSPKLEGTRGVYHNEDGSTAFAGIKFSKDNPVSPDTFDDFFRAEGHLDAQKDLGFSWAPEFINKGLKKYGRSTEAGGAFNLWATNYGVAINSVSNTMRKLGNMLYVDPQGRGLNKSGYLSVERQAQRIKEALDLPYGKYLDARWRYLKTDIPRVFLHGRKFALEADRLAELRYNEKYGGNKATPVGEVHPEIENMVEAMHEYRQVELEQLKNSAKGFGYDHENMLESAWQPVDHEFYRRSSMPMVSKFRHEFVGKDSEKQATDFLTEYCKRAARLKSDVIKAKLKRDKEMANNRLAEGVEKKSTDVTDKEVEAYIQKNAPAEAKALINPWDENLRPSSGSPQMGDLTSLRERLPMDTSMPAVLPNSRTEFSFDKNLRDFETDTFLAGHTRRVAGEAAMKNIYKDNKALERDLSRIKFELDKAVNDGVINRSRADMELRVFKDGVDKLRGLQVDDSAIGRAEAAGRILKDLSYAKYGGLMGFAQLGEAVGAISRGGMSMLAHIHPAVEQTLDRITNGKLTNKELRDMVMQMHMQDPVNRIYAGTWGNHAVRNAFNTDSLADTATRITADLAANLTKVTSTANQIGAMTKTQENWLLTSFWGDVIRMAHGEDIGKASFIKQALKAGGIPKDTAEAFTAIKKYFPMDANGKPQANWKAFMQEDPKTFYQLYEAANQFKEAGILNGNLKGNASIYSDNIMYKLLFQFKSFQGRAWAAGTRVLRDKNADELKSLALQMIGGVLGVAAMYKSRAIASELAGDSDSTDYYNKHLDTPMLVRAALFRTTLLQPISTANDIFEVFMGAPSIRTSTQGTTRRTVKGDEVIDDFLTRTPALRTVGDSVQAIYHMAHLAGNDKHINRKMMRDFIQAVPFPNIIPLAAMLESFANTYPKK